MCVTYRISLREKWAVRVRTGCAGYPRAGAFACIRVRLAGIVDQAVANFHALMSIVIDRQELRRQGDIIR